MPCVWKKAKDWKWREGGGGGGEKIRERMKMRREEKDEERWGWILMACFISQFNFSVSQKLWTILHVHIFYLSSFSPFLYHSLEEKRGRGRRKREKKKKKEGERERLVLTPELISSAGRHHNENANWMSISLLQLNWWCQSLRKSFFFPLQKMSERKKKKRKKERVGGEWRRRVTIK